MVELSTLGSEVTSVVIVAIDAVKIGDKVGVGNVPKSGVLECRGIIGMKGTELESVGKTTISADTESVQALESEEVDIEYAAEGVAKVGDLVMIEI